MEGSLFARQYILLSLHTKPMGWRVQRKCTDCVWLTSVLGAQFFGHCVPLPPQKSLGLKQLQNFYQKLLNCLVKSTVFSRSQYLVDFLQQTETQVFAATLVTSI